MNTALRETLVAFADAHKMRPDWHEPDEQDVMAKVRGSILDNARGDEYWESEGGRKNSGEIVVILTGPHWRISVNLANLLADYCALVREVGERRRQLEWRLSREPIPHHSNLYNDRGSYH